MTTVKFGDPEHVAYHEAGHAGLAIQLGRRFRHVTIRETEDAAGHVMVWASPPSFRPDIEVTPRGERLLRDKLMILLAGGIAIEKQFPGVATGDSLVENGFVVAGDSHEAVNMAMYVCHDSEEVTRYLEWLRVRTRSELDRPHVWAGVEEIVSALLERQYMSGTVKRSAHGSMVFSSGW